MLRLGGDAASAAATLPAHPVHDVPNELHDEGSEEEGHGARQPEQESFDLEGLELGHGEPQRSGGGHTRHGVDRHTPVQPNVSSGQVLNQELTGFERSNPRICGQLHRSHGCGECCARRGCGEGCVVCVI